MTATGSTARMRAAGCVCGLCSQPFWLWTTIANEQWAIAALSLFYAFSWGKGLRNNLRANLVPDGTRWRYLICGWWWRCGP